MIIGTKKKAAGAIKPIYLDYSDLLTNSQPVLLPGDKIIASDWTLAPGITREGSGFDNTTTHIWISSGDPGKSYEVTNHFELQSGVKDSRTFLLVIES